MRWPKLITAALLFALAAVVGEICYVLAGPNYFALAAGQCYRGSQPTAEFLEGRCRRDGLQTVINLRGENLDKDWYNEERAAADRLGLRMVDLQLSSNCPPTTADFRRLIDLLDHAPRPILIHCHSGSDRTGLAAMMYRLLQSDATLEQARAEISLRYGHKFWSEAARLWTIPDAYAEWLQSRGETHSPERFREWGLTVYRGSEMWRRLELEPPISADDRTP